MSTLISHFPSWMQAGIFKHLKDGGVGPWWADPHFTGTAEALDIEYLGNHSGCREASPLIRKLCCLAPEHMLTEVQLQRIVAVIKAKYAVEWADTWAAWITEYNPLENYSMTEDSNRAFKTSTNANTHANGDTNTDASVVPLGGTDPVRISNGRVTGNHTNNYTNMDTVTEGAYNDNREHLTRSGNIGVTTSQQMLQSEMELRQSTYFDYIYKCLDDVLTIPYWR